MDESSSSPRAIEAGSSKTMTTEQKDDESRAPASSKLERRFMIAALVAALLAATGAVLRTLDAAMLAETTKEQAVPSVATAEPTAGPGEEEVVLPGNIQAFFDARIRARVPGYVRDWKYDIGAKVKEGDILATVEAPELDRQLQQAANELLRADAEAKLASITAKRWSALRFSTAVSQQSADEKSGDFAAKAAAADAAHANVQRLQALQGFLQIVAPFDGVVTVRTVDIGDLVGPERAQELFSVADIHKVRIYVGTPQVYAAAIKVGMKAQLKLPQFPTRAFEAKVLTTSNAIAERSRTLLVQLLADNPEGVLLPGSYAEVHFKLPGRPGVLRVPATAILYRDNRLNVAKVGPNQRVVITPIKIARDLGTVIEASAGVAQGDRLILNPPQTLHEGDAVRPEEPKAPETSAPAPKAGAQE
jgi:RND family efflux transporter MFP subunit